MKHRNPSHVFHLLMRGIGGLLFVTAVLSSNSLPAQGTAKKRILVDIAHGQKFYNDPEKMAGSDSAFVARIKYMTGELKKNAAALNSEIGFQSGPLTVDALAKTDLLFVHIPSKAFTAAEVKAIQQFLNSGGSLFFVMDEDYWTTLAQVNVNEILQPFSVQFKSNSPDTSTGGYSTPGVITKKRFIVPYHGARLVEGGTPFAYSLHANDHTFGIYKEVGKGGRIIAMGDGMVSLYMTSWQGVNNYQCAEFMQDVLAWLLK
jgi:hypothetical protein